MIIAVFCIVTISMAAAISYWSSKKAKQTNKELFRRDMLLLVPVFILIIVNYLPLQVYTKSINASNRDIIILTDNTASMNAVDGREGGDTTRFDNLKQDIKYIQQISSGSNISILSYDYDINLAMPLTTNPDDIDSTVDSMFARLSDNHIPRIVKLSEAIGYTKDYLIEQEKVDPTRERIVVVMSDFEIFRKEETDEDIIRSYKELKKTAGGFINIVYGKPKGSKILRMSYDYMSSKVAPSHEIHNIGSIDYSEGSRSMKYLWDTENNYEHIISKPNIELADTIKRETKSSVASYTNIRDIKDMLDSETKSAIKKTSNNQDSQILRQNWAYAPLSALILILISIESILKPQWVHRIIKGKKKND